MNRAGSSTEYRLIVAAITGLCATAVVASVVPVVEAVTGAVLIAAGVAAVVGWVVRRERRIRRRLADVDGTTFWPAPPAGVGGAPVPRVGPGVKTPAPPATTTTNTSTSTSTSTADMSVHRAARAATSTGGAA